MPDVTILLDVPAGVGMERQAQQERQYDRLEAEALDFHERVRESFLAIAAEQPERVTVIDGTRSIGDIHAVVTQRVSAALH
jgi:dTMP kinase